MNRSSISSRRSKGSAPSLHTTFLEHEHQARTLLIHERSVVRPCASVAFQSGEIRKDFSNAAASAGAVVRPTPPGCHNEHAGVMAHASQSRTPLDTRTAPHPNPLLQPQL